ncbi:MAG: DUF4175 family protein [Pseudomonadota bacterium]
MARLLLCWERLWPAMLPALGVFAVVAIFSLLDLWRLAPIWLHGLALALAAIAFVAALWRGLRHAPFPSRREAQARLERDSALQHAPLQALDDAPSDPALADHPLWRAHLRESAARARAARFAKLRDVATARDPYGLRYITAGLLVIALIAGGDAWRDRLVAGMSPGAGRAGDAVADLWIEPPAYTGKAPIYLLRAGEEKSGVQDQINAPAGSRVVAQVNGRGARALVYAKADGVERASFEGSGRAARGELVLGESGLLRLKAGGVTTRWPVGVLPDAPPLVSFGEAPAGNDQGLFEFSLIAEDDYGLASAQLELRLDPGQERPLDAPPFDAAALSERRIIPLEGVAGGAGEHAVALDLQSDPWAGLRVMARVAVTDGAGQSAQSEETPAGLPARAFFNPLARVVIEQRQTLAVAAENWRRAGRSLDAVTLAPEVFYDRPTDYLMMRTAFWRVMREDEDGFDDAVERFWPLAVQLEDEALELARQRLGAAQEALRQAIERGADDQEIARLTEELRQAMDNYLQALAQSGQAMERQAGEGGQQIERSNLDEMLDAIRDLAQSGAGNAARQMLSDLENLLNNLRLTQGGGPGGDGPGARGQSGPSGEAGDLIGRQRELADDAFERSREGGEPNGEAGGGDLAESQETLGRDLDELIDGLQGGEADPNGDAARAMGRARNNMRDAEDALRSGDFDAAADAMERAIANMRDGAEGLAREEMRQAGDGRNGERGRASADPLGRPAGDAYGDGVEVPGASEAARTRAVINELRRRLGEPDRSEEEIDYLERLLERF